MVTPTNVCVEGSIWVTSRYLEEVKEGFLEEVISELSLDGSRDKRQGPAQDPPRILCST